MFDIWLAVSSRSVVSVSSCVPLNDSYICSSSSLAHYFHNRAFFFFSYMYYTIMGPHVLHIAFFHQVLGMVQDTLGEFSEMFGAIYGCTGSSCRHSLVLLSFLDVLMNVLTMSLSTNLTMTSGTPFFNGNLWHAAISMFCRVIFHDFARSITNFCTFSFSAFEIPLIITLFLLSYCSDVSIFHLSHPFSVCSFFMSS